MFISRKELKQMRDELKETKERVDALSFLNEHPNGIAIKINCIFPVTDTLMYVKDNKIKEIELPRIAGRLTMYYIDKETGLIYDNGVFENKYRFDIENEMLIKIENGAKKEKPRTEEPKEEKKETKSRKKKATKKQDKSETTVNPKIANTIAYKKFGKRLCELSPEEKVQYRKFVHQRYKRRQAKKTTANPKRK